jgi:Domain of unknown function (DUF5919)
MEPNTWSGTTPRRAGSDAKGRWALRTRRAGKTRELGRCALALAVSLAAAGRRRGDRVHCLFVPVARPSVGLFLDPDGSAIRLREQEENYDPGALSDLTRLNIRSLQDRVRTQLPKDARSRLEMAVYDETIRFNIVLVDEQLMIVQPYLPAMRGIDSPSLVLRCKWPDRGLFPLFEAIISSLWTRARPV